jgi:GNAT superfamily N-acetyltransferase
MSGLIIRRLKNEDLKSFYKIWEAHFGEEKAKERLRLLPWVLKGNPFSITKDDYYVAEVDGHIAGYHGSMPYKFSIEGTDVDAQIHFDALIDPDKRGQGIFTTLLEEMDKHDKPFTIALWFNENSGRIYEKLGWRAVSNINNYVRVYDVIPYISSKVPGFGYVLGRAANFILNAIYWLDKRFDNSPYEHLKIEEIKALDERVDSLFHELKKQFHVIPFRTHDVLNWRYDDKPGSTYKKMICLEGDVLRGYIIFGAKTNANGRSVVTILDFLCSPFRKDVFESLLNGALMEIEKERPCCVEILCSCHDFSCNLRKRLFFKTGKNDHAVKVKAPDQCDHVLDGNNWFFTYGDGDWDFWHAGRTRV